MTTLYNKGFHASEGSTLVHQFWGDIHTLSFRSDRLITDREVLADVVARFEEDREAFDRTLYNTYAENIKANRIYETLVPMEKSFDKIVFEYQGKTYSCKSTKWSKIREIEKKADKIIEHKEVFAECVINDRTNEIVAFGKVIRELDKLLFEDCI